MSYEMNPLVAGGIFGLTNMGMPDPDEATVRRAIDRVYPQRKMTREATIDDMVEIFAQQYVESDETYDAFKEEMESWYKRFLDEGTIHIQNTWPDRWALYQRAMNG